MAPVAGAQRAEVLRRSLRCNRRYLPQSEREHRVQSSTVPLTNHEPAQALEHALTHPCIARSASPIRAWQEPVSSTDERSQSNRPGLRQEPEEGYPAFSRNRSCAARPHKPYLPPKTPRKKSRPHESLTPTIAAPRKPTPTAPHHAPIAASVIRVTRSRNGSTLIRQSAVEGLAAHTSSRRPHAANQAGLSQR